MLYWLIILPLVGAIVSLLTPGKAVRIVAVAFSAALALMSLALPQMVQDGKIVDVSFSWISAWNVDFHLMVDGLSMPLIILNNFLVLICVLYSIGAVRKKEGPYYFMLFALQAGIVGTFMAADLFLFYVFWEMMLIPLYFMIGIWGSEQRIYAAVKFFLFTLAGSIFMLLSIIVIYLKLGTLDINEIAQLAPAMDVGLQKWLFCGFFVAFAIKVPLFPLHTWLPDAHTQAPTAGSIMLAGVLLKTGAYGMLRFCIPFFPEAAVAFSGFITVLATIAIIYGALLAFAQKDLKRLIAYSSVSHMGFVVLGIFTWNVYAISGGILQIISHGISTSGLFLCAGLIYDRTHTRELKKLGGLCDPLGKLTGFFAIMMLSSVGLPGLNGFVGELLILIGTFGESPWMCVFAATGVVLGAVYLLKMFQASMLGKVKDEKFKLLPDIGLRETFALLMLTIPAFWIGIYPSPVLERSTNPYAIKIVEQIRPYLPEKTPFTIGEAASGDTHAVPNKTH
jgi:NADH-quinone oxidoreductase subunit M